jgi:hypothetical protein
VQTLHGRPWLDLRGGDKPGFVIVQGSNRVIVELAHVKSIHSASLRDGMIAAMGNAAAERAGLLAASGVYPSCSNSIQYACNPLPLTIRIVLDPMPRRRNRQTAA